MKESKKHKQLRATLKNQKPGECALFDKKRKRYVNIKSFPPWKDPFNYSPVDTTIFIIIGGMIGWFLLNGWGMLLCGIGFGVLHLGLSYKRFN